jgi:hypothetical protein
VRRIELQLGVEPSHYERAQGGGLPALDPRLEQAEPERPGEAVRL